MFGIEKDFQNLMEQVYGPLNKDKMTDLKFTSPSGETTIKVEGTGRLGTVTPKTQLHIKMNEPVKYETPMTVIEDIEAQIKVLQSKLEFYKELEKTKTPCEEAYKRVYGNYPTTHITDGCWDSPTWMHFVNGYKSAQKDYKVGEFQETAQERGERVHNEMEETIRIHDGYGVVDYKPTPQTPEQVADGLKEAFREAVKQGVVSSSTKPQTLSDLIHDWWADVFTTGVDWDGDTCIATLIDEISLWLPSEHETNSYKWNECIRTIREKLR